MCLMPVTEISPPICLDGELLGSIIELPSKTVGQAYIGDMRCWVNSAAWTKSAATPSTSTAKATEPYCQVTFIIMMSMVTALSIAGTSGRLDIPEPEHPS